MASPLADLHTPFSLYLPLCCQLAHVPDANDDDEELLFLPTQPEPEVGEAAAGHGRSGDTDAMDVDAGASKGKARGGKRKAMGIG